MTNGGRISSGIIATIGGSLTILMNFLEFPTSGFTEGIWVLLLGLAGLTGGILLLSDVMAGGIITLIAGSIGILFSALVPFGLSGSFEVFLAVFHTMLLAGGITGIAAGSEF